MPSEHINEIDKEAHAPTPTEDMMRQDSLDKNLTEVDESQPKQRRSNRINIMMEDKLKEQELASNSTCYDILHEEDYELQDMMDDPIAFEAIDNPDNMCYHEAMRESDRG